MLVLDGIIYSLQKHGGITVYFNELLRRLRAGSAEDFMLVAHEGSAMNSDFLLPGHRIKPLRSLERYRRCIVPVHASLFHSSYYRLPDRCVPVVTTVHDFIYERFSFGPRKWLHSWQKFAAIRASAAVICISESTRNDLLEFLPDIPPERVHVVYNGVSSAFHPLCPEITNNDTARPYVLFVGARGGYKNFLPLVMAMADLRDLDLVSIGGGALTSEESELVQRKLSGRFTHHIGVTDIQLNRFYNRAFCLAYPSAYEGFGIPVLEAMRAGCPVVAMNSSSIPEVAGEAVQLMQEASPSALRQAILLLDQSGQREHYKQLGLKRASLFSWDRTFVETCKVYSSIISGN